MTTNPTPLPLVLGAACAECQDTGRVGERFCQCEMGQQAKIRKLYPRLDESQVAMQVKLAASHRQLREAWKSKPASDDLILREVTFEREQSERRWAK